MKSTVTILGAAAALLTSGCTSGSFDGVTKEGKEIAAAARAQGLVPYNGDASEANLGADGTTAEFYVRVSSEQVATVLARKLNGRWEFGCNATDGTFVAFSGTSPQSAQLRHFFSVLGKCPVFASNEEIKTPDNVSLPAGSQDD